MGFVNEVASIEDIKKYNLPFQTDVPENARRWWTRDKERNMYLLGGGRGNPAFGLDIYWEFKLFVDGKIFIIRPQIPERSKTFKEVPYRIAWGGIERIEIDEPRPHNMTVRTVIWRETDSTKTFSRQLPESGGMEYDEVVTLFKEALSVYGCDGENQFTPVFTVEFKF